MSQEILSQSEREAILSRLAGLGYTPEELNEAIAEHEGTHDEHPAVYCGTYGKYAGGSIAGKWIDLTTFDNFDDFINFCMAIHADEEDPELMFQDYECFPREWYSESCMDEDDFDKIQEYWKLVEEHGSEVIDAFLDCYDADQLEHFDEMYLGQYDDEEDYARQFVEENYDLDRMMGNLAQYFDYEAMGRDLFSYDLQISDGYVFRAY
ncbi:antirestriction protein ArdA [uncultured Duncaniella sp.]|uniref:antirestriction protein ArdA n=1 Tax=uncultured Duncaniella sp. TaxID=2768039 RepID=UPI00272A8DCB|nr:antirestriction protein ArdA [uncultured Duncaniella sp.]